MSDRYNTSERESALPPRPLLLRQAAKVAFLTICRAVGLFAIARQLTSRRWRILCYHGFSVADQYEYGPIMFMRPEVLRRRLATLQRLRLPVISLDEGLQQLAAGSIHGAPVTITIDDGWKTTFTEAAPILREFGFPACVYVTTYYSQRQVSVFNVVIWYMLWKTARRKVELAGVHPLLDGAYDLADPAAVGTRWITTLEANCDYRQREVALARIAAALDLDIEQVTQADRFKLVNSDEIVAMVKDYALDVQLHTHRHRLPLEGAEQMAVEIHDNRHVLEPLTNIPAVHFCYPSGLYIKEHPAWLAQAGVRSATTCDGGTNDATASPLLLRRYLDRDDWSDVEFEAVVSGFSELASDGRRALTSLFRRKAPRADASIKDAMIG